MDARAHDLQHRWVSVTREIPRVDPLSVAASAPDLSAYWENPSRAEAAACFGVATTLHRIPRDSDAVALSGDPIDGPGPWFGGVAFDVRAPAQWPGFPAVRWILPRALVWTRGDRSYLTHFSDGRAVPSADFPSAFPRHRYQRNGRNRPLETHASEDDWNRLIRDSLGAIEAGSLSKIVAARAIDATASSELNPLDLIDSLRSYAPTCTTFLFAAEHSAAVFVGATPETFCRMKGRDWEGEALAATAVPGDTLAWNERDKERREHDAVTEAILAGLRPLAESVQVEEGSVIALPNVRHMRTPIRAQLRESVEPFDVIQALHPTPAVGGAPRERAMSFLNEHENLARGWYAGVVGWIGCGRADLRVALRSALVEGRKARLFVGAGIVAGSVAKAEWLETEAKSVPMLQALRGGDAGRQP